MKKIRVSLKDRSYDIIIGQGLLKRAGPIIKKLNIGTDAVIITNSLVASLYARSLTASLKRAGISSAVKLVPDSERSKSYQAAMRIINFLSVYGKRKKLFVVALGGGVIGDLSGFVASVYKRGIPYIQVPTTLLAQVDSAIGGKVAIDLPVAKNLVGAFYQPKAVLSDTSLLKSLPARQIRSGMAEVIKYGVIEDARLFDFIEHNHKKILAIEKNAIDFVVARSAAIKARVVAKDEFDRKAVRIVLNYGHTVGHAIESASKYSSKYNHGEAVALGMIAAARISFRLGMIKKGEADRIEHVIGDVGLPVRILGVPIKGILASYIHDKKFVGGRNRLVLPEKVGRVRPVEGVNGAVIRGAIEDILATKKKRLI